MTIQPTLALRDGSQGSGALPLSLTPSGGGRRKAAARGHADPDPIEQIDAEDRADLALLRLVLCAALATAALALAGALQF